MCHKEVGGHLDVVDPGSPVESFSHISVFSCGSLMDERLNINRSPTMHPRRLPKRGLGPVPNSDRTGGIEEIPVLFIARVAHANPHLGGCAQI